MPVFDYTFTVEAPLTAVATFHQQRDAFKKLTPPPIIAQVHTFEPMGEGSVTQFTLWFGPFPVHWRAVHHDVSQNGFTDVQARGPLKAWQHTHRFTAVSAHITQIHEHIEYEYPAGWRGLTARLLFNPLGLRLLFIGRKLLTRYHVARMVRPAAASSRSNQTAGS